MDTKYANLPNTRVEVIFATSFDVVNMYQFQDDVDCTRRGDYI
jgi:hypothetical protein